MAILLLKGYPNSLTATTTTMAMTTTKILIRMIDVLLSAKPLEAFWGLGPSTG